MTENDPRMTDPYSPRLRDLIIDARKDHVVAAPAHPDRCTACRYRWPCPTIEICDELDMLRTSQKCSECGTQRVGFNEHCRHCGCWEWAT